MRCTGSHWKHRAGALSGASLTVWSPYLSLDAMFRVQYMLFSRGIPTPFLRTRQSCRAPSSLTWSPTGVQIRSCRASAWRGGGYLRFRVVDGALSWIVSSVGLNDITDVFTNAIVSELVADGQAVPAFTSTDNFKCESLERSSVSSGSEKQFGCDWYRYRCFYGRCFGSIALTSVRRAPHRFAVLCANRSELQ